MKGTTLKLPPPELRSEGFKRVVHAGPAGGHINGALLLGVFGREFLQNLGAAAATQVEPEFPFLKEASK